MSQEYIRYPNNSSIVSYPSAAQFPATNTNGALVLALDTDTLYVYSTNSNTYVPIASPGSEIAITALTGDVTATGPGVAVATIADSVITNSMFVDAPAHTVKGNNTGAPAPVTDLALGDVTEATSDVLTITGGTDAIIGSALTIAVTQSTTSTDGYLSSTDWNTFNGKLTNTLPSADIFVGNGSNVATAVAMSGDTTIINTGIVTIGNNKVTNDKLAQMVASTIKANPTGSTANATDITLSGPLGFNGSSQLQGPFTSFYFQPGGTATNAIGGNIYTNFTTLYADFIKAKGGHIYIDDSLGACTMPAGTYDFIGATFHGVFVGLASNPLLNLANGVIWTNLPTMITDNLIINSQSTAPIWTSPSVGTGVSTVLILTLGAHIKSSGGAPLLKIGGSGGTGDIITILADTDTSIDSGISGNEVIWLVNNASAILFGGLISTFDSAILKDDGSSAAIVLIGVGSAQFSTIQPNFTGVVIINLGDAALYHQYDNSISGLVAGNVQAAIDEIAAGAQENRLSKYDSAANSGTGETNLTSKAMPAGDLLTTYDGYFIRAGGAFAATASLKRVRMYYGATVIADTGSVVLNNGRWHIEARVYSDGSGTAEKAFSWGVTTLTALANFGSSTTPAEILGNSITIKCTGQGTSTSDVTQDFMDITLIKGLA